jgi:hypothetical protein
MVLEHHKLTQESFAWLLGEIESRFQTCLVNPGEMVCDESNVTCTHDPWFVIEGMECPQYIELRSKG